MNEEKIEAMLAQLIKMVGSIQSEQQGMKQELHGVKQKLNGVEQEQRGMKQELHGVKQKLDGVEQKLVGVEQEQYGMKQELENMQIKAEERHQEILDRFKVLERDQDFIWEKTARNEREIGNIKRRLDHSPEYR